MALKKSKPKRKLKTKSQIVTQVNEIFKHMEIGDKSTINYERGYYNALLWVLGDGV